MSMTLIIIDAFAAFDRNFGNFGHEHANTRSW